MYPGKWLQKVEHVSLPTWVLLAGTDCYLSLYLSIPFLPSVQGPLFEPHLTSPHLPHLNRRLLAEEQFWTVLTS